MSKNLEIERQKAAQLMAFAFGMVERGEFKKIPQNASSDEKYAIRCENVAKAMKELIHNAPEYNLTFTGDVDTWTRDDFLTQQGLPTVAKKAGTRLGEILAEGMKAHVRGRDMAEAIKREAEYQNRR